MSRTYKTPDGFTDQERARMHGAYRKVRRARTVSTRADALLLFSDTVRQVLRARGQLSPLVDGLSRYGHSGV